MAVTPPASGTSEDQQKRPWQEGKGTHRQGSTGKRAIPGNKGLDTNIPGVVQTGKQETTEKINIPYHHVLLQNSPRWMAEGGLGPTCWFNLEYIWGVVYHTAVDIYAPPCPTGRRLLVQYSDNNFKHFHLNKSFKIPQLVLNQNLKTYEALMAICTCLTLSAN